METFAEFYKEQPPLLFIEELKSPFHKEKPDWFNRKEIKTDEVSVKGIYIVNNFPDRENLLETAVCDFELFTDIFEIRGKDYPLVLEYCETAVFEEYIITVKENCTTIKAGDTEGIRRGIIFIEDELQRREGAFLPMGDIKRTPRIKSRITRGFFSPTNRPPKNIDELFDDVDYYPEEYLNRLAHDGTNGLWIYTRLSDLVKTDIIPEYGKDSEKRIEKLKKIIRRCKRYGVKVYIFFIEPYHLLGELPEKHPDILGHEVYPGMYTFCVNTPLGEKYCIEAMEKLCRMLPDLGGFIDITNGERPTSCASGDNTKCPRCKNYSKAEIVAKAADLLKEGIRRAGTGAEFISWTYGHRSWPLDAIEEYVKNIPDDVAVMENFEDMGVFNQLSKDHLAVDYWLSYVGPSKLYETAANAAEKYGKHMYAKMQVCCSHEIATVPYIPVPGILFEKFGANVEGVMECWYFGNYPSLMSKAAGELSFLHDLSDKEQFLKHLAGIYCGNSHAEETAKAWMYFEEGYKNYPVNIMFSYYGPMHDGVCWELQLEPKYTNLPRTWLYQDAANGDNIFECIQLGHSLEEVTTLLAMMKESWQNGIKILPKECPDEQRHVAKALDLLIRSGNNIMNFYKMREELENSEKDGMALLSEMENIVKNEIENSRRMIDICIADSRLGYHSEAENYKFFPEQLKKRINALNTLLETEFKTVAKRIEEGKEPFEAPKPPSLQYKLAKNLDEAKKEVFGISEASFKAAYDNENLYLELEGKKDAEFTLMFSFKKGWYVEDVFFKSGKSSIPNLYLGLPETTRKELLEKFSFEYESGARDKYKITVNRKELGWTEDKPFYFRVSADSLVGDLWSEVKDPFLRLGIYYVPEEFGLLVP